MNPFDYILPAFQQVLTLNHLLIIFGGLVLGVVIGAIPGLTVTMGIILLLPLTHAMDNATVAIISLMAVYVGGMYGGSIPAILLNTPGTNAAITTTFDGYPLAKKGKIRKALNLSLYSSVFGGLLASIVLLFLSAFIASFVGGFASPEYFAIGILGLTLVAGVSASNLPKGILAALIGLFVAFIGADLVTGVPRFTFGSPLLQHGIQIIPVMIALIALTQVLLKSQDFVLTKGATKKVPKLDKEGVSKEEVKKAFPASLRGGIVGTLIGAMPGTGGCVAQFMAYNEARRASKRPQDFGKGSLEGIAAAEASNNAVATAALIPLLTLGIPGDGVAALLLGAFVLHGIQPGPAMFTNHALTTYTIMSGIVIANILLLFIGLVFTRVMARAIQVRYTYLAPIIIAFCFAGAFAASGHAREIIIAAAVLVISYFLNLLKISIIPLLLGMILAPVLETNFVTSMMANNNDLLIFFRRPVSAGILVLTAILLYSLLRVNKKIQAMQDAEQAAHQERFETGDDEDLIATT